MCYCLMIALKYINGAIIKLFNRKTVSPLMTTENTNLRLIRNRSTCCLGSCKMMVSSGLPLHCL